MKRTRITYQFGTIECRNGKWIYRWADYSTGRYVRRGRTLGSLEELPTEAAALRKADGFRLVANKSNPRPSTVTFGALLERYLNEEAPGRHDTDRVYRSYIENHIRPQWEDVALIEVFSDPGAVESWLRSLDLGAKTKGNIKGVMQTIAKCAMRWKLLPYQDRSSLSLVRVPGVSRRRRKPRVLSVAELAALLEQITVEPYRTMVLLDIVTGLRESELFALQWCDFDWMERTMLVRRSIVDGRVDNVKTEYSETGMPLDDAVIQVLFQWRQQSRFTEPDHWLFASEARGGRLPLSGNAVRADHLKPAAQRAGLGEIGWHTFRHTFRALLGAAGTPISVQKDLMRHADIRTTMNVYGQAPSQPMREAHGRIVRMVLPT